MTKTGDSRQSADARIGIVAAEYNNFIVEHLLSGCLQALHDNGVSDERITVVKVPGAFELALAAQRLAATGRVDAIVALGCVIRGATAHFDYVAGECAAGLTRISLDASLPVAFGVLTVENLEQAIERSGSKAGNKGADAALAALRTLSALRQIDDP